jgi:hypothetical protein
MENKNSIDLQYYLDEIREYLQDPKIKKFVEFCQKSLEKKTDNKEIEESEVFFNDKIIQRYLKAVERVGSRMGWIYGSISGGIIGIIMATFGLSGSGAPLIVLGLLGGILGGIVTGYIASKILKIIYRWKAESDIVSGKHTDIVVGGNVQVPIFRPTK